MGHFICKSAQKERKKKKTTFICSCNINRLWLTTLRFNDILSNTIVPLCPVTLAIVTINGESITIFAHTKKISSLFFSFLVVNSR